MSEEIFVVTQFNLTLKKGISSLASVTCGHLNFALIFPFLKTVGFFFEALLLFQCHSTQLLCNLLTILWVYHFMGMPLVTGSVSSIRRN